MSELTLHLEGWSLRCTVERSSQEFVVRIGETEHRVRIVPLEPGVLRLTASGSSHLVRIAHVAGRWFLHLDGQTVDYQIGSAEVDRYGSYRPARDDLSAPMPGVVAQVLVREGDAVTPGQPLVIVEAMKVEHIIRSPRYGRIGALRVRAGEQIDSGTVVAEIALPVAEGDAE